MGVGAEKLDKFYSFKKLWISGLHIIVSVLLSSIFLTIVSGCTSSDDPISMYVPKGVPTIEIDENDVDYPLSRTYEGIISLSGTVFSETGNLGGQGCYDYDVLFFPDPGVKITWFNQANNATGSSYAYWTTVLYGLCDVVWNADNIPLSYGKNEIIIFAEGISGTTAEVRVTFTRVPYRPLQFSRVTCNGEAALYWFDYLGGANSFNLYYSTDQYISLYGISIPEDKAGVNRISNVTPPYTPTGLDSNKTFYFVLVGLTEDAQLGWPSEELTIDITDCTGTVPTAPPEENFIWELPGNSYIDLDSGVISQSSNSSVDLYWDAVESYIRPMNSALIKNLFPILGDIYNDVEYENLTSLGSGLLGYYASSERFYDTFKPLEYCYGVCLHTVFTIYTTDGNFAKFQVLEYKPEERSDGTSKYLVFRYYTF